MQVTLTTKYTVYNLLTLLRALTGLTNRRAACRFYSIQNDAANGGDKLYKGTALMTVNGGVGPVANFDFQMLATIVYPQSSEREDIDLSAVYLASDTDGAIINVQVTDR